MKTVYCSCFCYRGLLYLTWNCGLQLTFSSTEC